MGAGQGVDGAVERFVAAAVGLDPLQARAAFDVFGDQALGGELLEDLGRQQAAQEHVAGAGLLGAQAAVDFGLGGVGADGPELDAALDLVAAPVHVHVCGLAQDGLAGLALALHGVDVGVLVGAGVGVDGLGVVAARVDHAGDDGHGPAAGVQHGGAAVFGEAGPHAAGFAFGLAGVAVEDGAVHQLALHAAAPGPEVGLDAVALGVHAHGHDEVAPLHLA